MEIIKCKFYATLAIYCYIVLYLNVSYERFFIPDQSRSIIGIYMFLALK